MVEGMLRRLESQQTRAIPDILDQPIFAFGETPGMTAPANPVGTEFNAFAEWPDGGGNPDPFAVLEGGEGVDLGSGLWEGSLSLGFYSWGGTVPATVRGGAFECCGDCGWGVSGTAQGGALALSSEVFSGAASIAVSLKKTAM